jgi:putative ABC transport system substrate-binding protein
MNAFTRSRRIAPAILAAMVAVCATQAPARSEERSAVVITSRDEEPYSSVLQGIRGPLSAHGVAVDVHSLQSDESGANRALTAARKSKRTPLITVGSVAAKAAIEAPGDGPVVACMIVNQHGLSGAKNATGVVLEFPVETQLEWMHRFVPDAASIGVIYDPKENRARIEAAKGAASRLGMRLLSRPIERPQALPDALESLARDANVLWGVTDRLVLSPQTAEAILLFSFRNRIPFAGLSSSWVKAGALYALDRDYADLGAQCGEMTLEVLNGRSPESLPPAAPRKVTYAVNLKTAEHMKIELSPDLVDNAQQVFR